MAVMNESLGLSESASLLICLGLDESKLKGYTSWGHMMDKTGKCLLAHHVVDRGFLRLWLIRKGLDMQNLIEDT